MFRRIVVPIDFTARSRRAVAVAARLAAASGAETILLHVIERIGGDGQGAFAGFYQKLGRRARAKLRDFLEVFPRKGLDARGEVVYGGRVNEILRFADASRADLLVMTSHKLPVRRGAENWGTISYKVGILSRCPVLLVK